MAKIRQLSRQMADMIAAGEVVERPASVVKELLENAIDAGAHVITIELEHGGTGYLRVTDNGSGISSEDVETAFLRHATSKISTPEDLDGVMTLGFRGEALAAICSVSRMEILTLAEGETLGTSLTVQGGEIISRGEVGCPKGTTMIVRDLFYNTPARMKFLKKDAVEAAQVIGVVQRAAISRPDISFRLIRDGKMEIHTPGDNRLTNAVYHVFGKDFSSTLMEISSEYEGIRVKGMISRPDCCRGNRSMQHFFVNGRPIRSKTLTAALEEGYKNRIPSGRFPSCVLKMELSPHKLDVNIHPTKAEIKFQNERTAFYAVYFAVQNAFDETDQRKQIHITSTPQQSVLDAVEMRSSTSAKTTQFSHKLDAFPPVRSFEREPITLSLKQDEKPFYGESTEKIRKEEQTSIQEENVVESTFAQESSPVLIQDEKITQISDQVEETATSIELPDSFRVIGETMNTYILVEQEDKLILIDKHAAHERILYEKLKNRVSEIPTQMLLSPIAISLAAEDTAILLEEQELISSLGFLLEDFGGSLLVRGVPADLAQVDPAILLGELASKIRSGSRMKRLELRDLMLYTMACKAAIKGGWKTGQEELEFLTEQVMKSNEIRQCPHGRPVLLEISRTQLEHQFNRA